MKNKIREIRKARGITQVELAEILHMPQQRISRVETGTTELKIKFAAKICSVLNCEISDIFPELFRKNKFKFTVVNFYGAPQQESVK